MNRLACFLTLIVFAALSPPVVRGDTAVYVSVAGEQRIAVYAMNEEDGELRHLSNMQLGAEPGPLTTDPAGKFLFASIRSAGQLASFRRDPATGNLTLISQVPAGADPAYVATDHTGRFLLSAYYRAGKVVVHRIGDDGSLAAEPLQTLATDDKAHAIVPDRTNKFVFVPHTGPNAIFQFHFDAANGLLAPNQTPKVIRPPETGPRHLGFHPTANFAFVSDEQGSSMTTYRFDPDTGWLSATQTISTLPEGFSKRNSTAHLEVHPSGQWVYVANRGHDSLAGFRIDSRTGRATALGQTLTEQTPRSFNIDPSGRFLLAAGQGSGKLAAFRIDQQTGGLSRIATYEIGNRPWWVLAAKCGSSTTTK